MFCPSCGTKNEIDMAFCKECGTKLNQIVTKNKKFEAKKGGKTILVIIIVLLIILLSLVLINYFSRTEIQNKPSQKEEIKEETSSSDNNLTRKYNSFEKIKNAYNNKEINVNEYFKQLVFMYYAEDLLDEKYKSDYKFTFDKEAAGLTDIFVEHQDELDKNIKEFFLYHETLQNVHLTPNKSQINVEEQNRQKFTNKIEFLNNSDEEEKSTDPFDDWIANVANHQLNRAYLSSNGKFLIWYADKGSDEISEDQLIAIATTLENTLLEYEKIFNISFKYDNHIETKFDSEDHKNALEILNENEINKNAIETAMSIYIYNMGSNAATAEYSDVDDLTKLINAAAGFYVNALDEDGVVSYPYIRINRNDLVEDSLESLKQVVNHELFHHFQDIYCRDNIDKDCVAGLELTEAMANYASALVSEQTDPESFLNGWATAYSLSIDSSLESDMNFLHGYWTFPYYYSYSNNMDNWADIIMQAHLKENGLAHLKMETPKEKLIDIINEVAYRNLNQVYENKNFIVNETIFNGLIRDYYFDATKAKYPILYRVPKTQQNIRIRDGAVNYYKLDNATKIKAFNPTTDYITFAIYGYSNGQYHKLESSQQKIEFDASFYVNYSDFYLVVTNADIIWVGNYDIEVENSPTVENTEFVTTFDNYNIEISMDSTISGINVKINATGVVDEKHQKQYLDYNSTTMGITLKNKMYHDFNSGYSYMTQPYGGDVWWKEKNASYFVDLKLILEKLTNMEGVTKINKNQYKVKMTKKDIEALMKTSNVDTTQLAGDIYANVYTENGYIVKLEYDFSKANKLFENFKTTISFSNYNNAGDVNIPQSIVDGAKDV